MRRRNEYDRSYGYGGNWGEQDRSRDQGRDRGYSEQRYSPGRSGMSGYDDDERYFGGSRRYGEGYNQSDYEQGRGSYGRGLSSYRRDQRDDRFFGENYPDRDDYDRYYEDSPRRDISSAGYGGGYTSGEMYGGGMYGGGIGGYSGGGYQGYNPGYQGINPSSYRTTDYRSSRGYYSPDYPRSERGYSSGRSSRQNERGWWDRTSDEVASWFGDEEAERRRQMDYRDDGRHRGKGPKGYTRSDDRIKEDVSDRLEDSSYLDASDIDIDVNSAEVVLKGTVSSRYAKRLAEDLVEDCSGVKNVENRLRVDSDWYENRYGSSTASESSASSSGNKTKAATSR